MKSRQSLAELKAEVEAELEAEFESESVSSSSEVQRLELVLRRLRERTGADPETMAALVRSWMLEEKETK